MKALSVENISSNIKELEIIKVELNKKIRDIVSEFKELNDSIASIIKETNGRLSDDEITNMQMIRRILKQIDFRNADLSGMDLSNIDFSNCDFTNTNFSDCMFNNCVFENTIFCGTNLISTDFGDSSLSYSIIKNVKSDSSTKLNNEDLLEILNS